MGTVRVEVDIVYKKAILALRQLELYTLKRFYCSYDQGTNVKRITTVIVKYAI